MTVASEETEGGVSVAEELHCPSAPAAPGAKLFGIVQADGRVGLFGKALTVDEAFLAKARKGRAPEKRFRFAAPCVQQGCRQWRDGQCGVIRRVMEAVGEAAGGDQPDGTKDAGLQPCALRGHCRWFAERGRAACGVCPEVITDTLPT